MRSYRYKQVDVFTQTRFKGNPVAVVLDASGLSDAQMQQIANWTNLSETTFVLPASDAAADYRLRIFTPHKELPFAGHPTIGTAHALLEAGLIHAKNGILMQECSAGLIRLCINLQPDGPAWIAFDLPPAQISTLSADQIQEVGDTLGIAGAAARPPLLIDIGPRWIVAQCQDAASVLACRPDFERMRRQDSAAQRSGVVIFGAYPAGSPADFEVRAFAPAAGVNEDPVCGSGNGGVAVYLRHTDQVPAGGSALRASQGAILGRAGQLRLQISEERITVGGQAVTCIDGSLSV